MSKKYAVINYIEKETEKAILVSCNGMTWLPKSQVEIINTQIATVVILPAWLWFEKKSFLSILTTAEQIYETTGIICN